MQLSRSTILQLLLMAYSCTIPLNREFLNYATSIILLNHPDPVTEATKNKIIYCYKSPTAVRMIIKTSTIKEQKE